MLLVNGVKDTQVPIDDLMLVARTVPGGIKETWVNPNGGHMGADKEWGSERIRKEVTTPWLIKMLKGAKATGEAKGG
jgi:hypothetical protein